ncbi:hypothetical protein QUF75_18625 [Desulfococcaceae bacterium HSG7]|nr:hypothetical protein [Desulfococcaceae bacterium HSG7]
MMLREICRSYRLHENCTDMTANLSPDARERILRVLKSASESS